MERGAQEPTGVVMPDRFRLQVRGRKPPLNRGKFFENGGYRFGRAEAFRWDDLIETADANGFKLTRPLLHKWRVWRFLPPPVAGGRTARGRGKGQTWPLGAGWRVGWMSHWLAATLTYDVLRLAIWPWTPAFDTERARDVIESLQKFLRQDEHFQRRVMASTNVDEEPDARTYADVVLSPDGELSTRGELLQASGAPDFNSRAFIDNIVFTRFLNFADMRETADAVTPDELGEFITQFRAAPADQQSLYVDIFWDSPLALARIIVRGLHRYKLTKEGRI